MTVPPAVVVHGLGDALAALSHDRPVLLLSAPGAGLYAGCGWWRALVAAARQARPDAVTMDALDCADAPGRALEALSVGCGIVILAAREDVFRQVAAIAAETGATLWSARPPALDLSVRGAARRLPQWLGMPPPAPDDRAVRTA